MANENLLLLQQYVQEAYETTVEYYRMNLLAINPGKTDLIIVPPKNEEQPEAYIMTHKGKIIASVKNIKILGVHFNSSNNMESHMLSVASRIGLAFKKLEPFIAHAPPKQRKTIINSKLRSIALYCSPLFFNESTHCKKRFESVLMTINKKI